MLVGDDDLDLGGLTGRWAVGSSPAGAVPGIAGRVCQFAVSDGAQPCARGRMAPWYPRGSAWRPAQRPAAEDVGVGVEDRLPGLRPGVEDDPVPGLADPFVLRDLVRQDGHLVQQAVVGRGERGQIPVVVLRYDQHVAGCLGVDVPERQDTGRLGHPLGRDIARHDPAEKAIRHGAILACYPPNRPPPDMVAWLRILGARPYCAWTRPAGFPA